MHFQVLKDNVWKEKEFEVTNAFPRGKCGFLVEICIVRGKGCFIDFRKNTPSHLTMSG
jgi:hypothetical protein